MVGDRSLLDDLTFRIDYTDGVLLIAEVDAYRDVRDDVRFHRQLS